MATYSRMGAFLLSGELASDSLGKVLRGVSIIGNTYDRHVLIRTFSDELLQAGLASRLLEASKLLPQLGGSKAFGLNYRIETSGTPHVACDYIPGRSLAQLIEKAKQEQIPFGVDHALSVVQGLAQGIIQLHSKGLSHGTLSPHSVWVSFEGAAMLLDVPFAAPLKALAAKTPFLKASLEPYASDKAGHALAQDLYALGAILYELLTFERLTVGAGPGSVLHLATLKAAQEDAPIPAEIQGLLQRLLLVGQPYEDVQAFNGDLERVLYDGDYSPTTFNMAFFMHTLFREENDRDALAMKADQSEDFAAYASAVEAAKVRPIQMEPVRHEGEVVAQKSTLVKAVVGVAAALALIVGGGWLYIRGQHKEMEKIQGQLASLQQEQALSLQKAADLQNQEQAVLKEKEKAQKELASAKSTTEREDKQKQLLEQEKRLEEITRQRQEEERKQKERETRAQQLAATVAAKGAVAPPPAAPQPSPQPAGTSGSAQGSQAASGAPQVAAKAQEPPKPGPAAPSPQPAASTPPPPAPTPTPSLPPQSAPAAPAVETPVQLVTQSTPSLPSRARNPMNPHRTKEFVNIRLRVFVDAQGRAQKVTIVEGADGPWGYNEAAQEAALQSTFAPATKDGKPVTGYINMNVRFARPR